MPAAVDYKSWAVWTPVLATLLSGTASALANKVAFDTPVKGKAGCGEHKFQKAYWFTLCMFLGEALCLAVYHGKLWFNRRREASAYQTLAGAPDRVSPQLSAVNQMVPPSNFGGGGVDVSAAGKKPPIWVYAVLCIFDLAATSVGGVGLIWVDASTNQMLRGSMVVFCAIFSVLMLKRRLSGPQWGSIGVVCLGLVLVGMSGMLKKHYQPSGSDPNSDVTSGQLAIGILLVLLASALNAVQNVFEEKLLKAVGDAEVDPLELVGWEGVFGTIFSAFVLLPIVYHIPGDDCGKAEDTLDTLAQLKNDGLPVAMSIIFAFSLFVMNWQSQQITAVLSAVHRNLVSAVRTVLVWIASIIMYYATRGNKNVYGEKWTNWTLVEVAGFVVLVSGTVMYSYFGVKLAAAQAAAERDAGLLAQSPEFAVPIEPTLAEHQQIAKQHMKHGNGNGYTNGYDVYNSDE